MVTYWLNAQTKPRLCFDTTVIFQNGNSSNIAHKMKATTYEHKTGNNSVNKHINNGDQYGAKKLCIRTKNQYKIVRHKSHEMRKKASHKENLPKERCCYNTKC